MIKFDSSNEVLKRGFEWAKKTALSYVFENAPGGPCYEAALPGRGAFCMRDVSHQALGAHFLGLQPHNRNMMRLFSRNIAESRDWCSFWEMNTRGEVCEVDYTSDAKFWYNLPANFDVTTTCERLMEWTGDAGYLTDEDMARFHGITVGEYVKRWDRDGDGIVDRDDADRARGVGSYDEDEFNGYTAAADTLALEAAAYFTAARMYRLTGDEKNAALSRKNGEALAEKYRREWWNAAAGHYENNLYPDGTMGGLFTCAKAGFPLRYGLITEKEKIAAQLDYLTENTPERTIEDRSYVPEILWKYGRNEDALKLWMSFADENCPRREYPEVSYAMIETLVVGYLGMSVSAEDHAVNVRPAAGPCEWAEARDVPLWGGCVDLRVEGESSVTLTNRTGREITLTVGENRVSVPDGDTAECKL